MGLILGTPFILNVLAPDDLDWGRLSNVSQSYGALSVLFSAAALAGVAASLWYQARQTQIAQEAARRDAHRELIVLALGDPSLLPCWEPPHTRMTAIRRKQILFANLIVTNWESDFRLGNLDEAALRDMFDGHFRGEIAREHWVTGGRGWGLSADLSADPMRRQFVEIAGERYALAVADGPPVAAAEYFETAP
ncbi:DUF6082 family protein [Streptomyces olivochromogenes]|uniref:DUF6082 family protein n=1 Tax=Streptomyces olivochromogenes TaxID=1963 RepID=UPI001F2812E9|nr:DUF6082 family protein [Streptomyces olivochromogenes]MCF3130230.1 hypothetical protein [Streptomyces olivochromogenes]